MQLIMICPKGNHVTPFTVSAKSFTFASFFSAISMASYLV